jgi:hypothetical protein
MRAAAAPIADPIPRRRALKIHNRRPSAGRPGRSKAARKITRRRMLAAAGGLAALAAAKPGPAGAHPMPIVPNKTRRGTMEIKRSGSRPSGKGPADHFTGGVRIDPLFQAPDPAGVRGASVTFEAGARTAWHTYPLGRILIVTFGRGWVQAWGGPVEEITQVTWSGFRRCSPAHQSKNDRSRCSAVAAAVRHGRRHRRRRRGACRPASRARR